MKNHMLAAATAVCLVASPAIAQTTVDFDQSTDPTTYASQGLTLNGVTILADTFGNAVNVPSQPNYATVNIGGGTLGFVDPTTGAATTANNFGLTVPGLNLTGGYYAGFTLTFLSSLGDTIGTQFFAPVGPNEFRGPIQYANNLQNIAQVLLTRTENSSGPALAPFDNVTFTLNAAGGAVPEPATWAMLILGMGMVGGVMRRKVRAGEVRFAV